MPLAAFDNNIKRIKKMPDYKLTFEMVDSAGGGRTTKTHYGTFADFATADTAADALLTDYVAASGALIENIYLAEEKTPVGVQDGKSVFQVADGTISLTNKGNANFKLPAAKKTLFSGNALIVTDAWADLMANFAVSVGWTLSDSNTYNNTVRGKRAYVASGKTNLS